jgi:hypothetical protein
MQNAVASAVDEIYSIAEGLSRTDVEPRARRAFAYANKCRAAYPVWDIQNLNGRMRAISYATIWSAILDYFDISGAESFSKAAYDKLDNSPRRRVINALAFFDVPGWIAAVRVTWGSKPVVFYEPWGLVQ